MKKFYLLSLCALGFLILFTVSSVKAQDEMPPNGANQKPEKPRRQDILRELGLTLDQRQQMKQINIENKPRMMQAQRRFREANRNLDQAIYADIVDDAQVQARLKEAQSAQSEVFRIRALTELAVRRILTPEQLQKFRELRERFVEGMENRDDRPPEGPPPVNNPKANRLRPKN